MSGGAPDWMFERARNEYRTGWKDGVRELKKDHQRSDRDDWWIFLSGVIIGAAAAIVGALGQLHWPWW